MLRQLIDIPFCIIPQSLYAAVDYGSNDALLDPVDYTNPNANNLNIYVAT